ncbi:uncharacterized protein LOC127851818 isoform X3 [Dreissena polymorpha]|uniref:uncharacterized protein LOC127851818 isoform X3 n=1 Tax=Dreissena polymorpha TaxID=45954 RepID=UPI00226451B0|nr:uncharacterized protein LOC127851818 isoform X3 [Dreissena polymorpha]
MNKKQSSSSEGKSKRQAYDNAFKARVIQAAEESNNNCATALVFDVSESTVRDWRRAKEAILNGRSDQKRHRTRKGQTPLGILESEVKAWILEQQKKGVSLTRIQIRKKAWTMSKEAKYVTDCEGFQASTGWYSRFMKRSGLGSLTEMKDRATVEDDDFKGEGSEVTIETDMAELTEPVDHMGDHDTAVNVKREAAGSTLDGEHSNESEASSPPADSNASPVVASENSGISLKAERTEVKVDEPWEIPESSCVSLDACVTNTEENSVCIPCGPGDTDSGEVTDKPSDMDVDTIVNSGNSWNHMTEKQSDIDGLILDMNKDTRGEVCETVNAFSSEHSSNPVEMETEESQTYYPEKSFLQDEESNHEVVNVTHESAIHNVTVPEESIALSTMISETEVQGDVSAVEAMEDSVVSDNPSQKQGQADDEVDITEDLDSITENSPAIVEPARELDTDAYNRESMGEVEEVTKSDADSNELLNETDADALVDISESHATVEDSTVKDDIADEHSDIATATQIGLEAADNAEELPVEAVEPENVPKAFQVTEESNEKMYETDVKDIYDTPMEEPTHRTTSEHEEIPNVINSELEGLEEISHETNSDQEDPPNETNTDTPMEEPTNRTTSEHEEIPNVINSELEELEEISHETNSDQEDPPNETNTNNEHELPNEAKIEHKEPLNETKSEHEEPPNETNSELPEPLNETNSEHEKPAHEINIEHEEPPNETNSKHTPNCELDKEEIHNETSITVKIIETRKMAEDNVPEVQPLQKESSKDKITDEQDQLAGCLEFLAEDENNKEIKHSLVDGSNIETNGLSNSADSEAAEETTDLTSAIRSSRVKDEDERQLNDSNLKTENANSGNIRIDNNHDTHKVFDEDDVEVNFDDTVKEVISNESTQIENTVVASLENETEVIKDKEHNEDKTAIIHVNDAEHEKMDIDNDVDMPSSEKTKIDDTENSNDVTEGMEVIENSMEQMDESSNLSGEHTKHEESSSSDNVSVSAKEEKMKDEKSKDLQNSSETAASINDNSCSPKGDNASSLSSDDAMMIDLKDSSSTNKLESLKSLETDSKDLAKPTIKEEKTDKEDDDVIAIKEEKKPPPKVLKSKMQKCIVCAKFGKCKYNIVRNGDIKHLCDDECFKRFRASPTTYLRQVEVTATLTPGDKIKATGASQAPVTPASAPTASEKLAAKLNEKAAMQQTQKDYKTCSVCQLINVRTAKPFLNWQGMDYCGEECLGKFQAGLSSTCSNCSTAIFQRNKTKYICNVGSELKHFCSEGCHADFLKKTKFCAYCNKDLSTVTNSFMAPVDDMGHFKDFCGQVCLQNFEIKNKEGGETTEGTKWKSVKVQAGNHSCAVCNRMAVPKHCLQQDNSSDKFSLLCSDPCLSAFKYANKIELSCCDQCGLSLNGDLANGQIVQFEGQQRRFCSFMCVNLFRTLNLKRVQCAWCSTKKNNFDMIERVDASNRFQLFCSLNCLSLYRVNLQATSNQNVVCDQCRKFVPAQYHLTMSDASVRNFCSYGCVMTFQQQFQTPVKPSTPQQPAPTQQQQPAQKTTPQQTVTRSGRVVSLKGNISPQPNMPAARNNIKAVSAATNVTDSFPIISNVISLAPQKSPAPQPEVNMKTLPAAASNTPTPVGKTSSAAGSQMVHQQIIIQPPSPKPMKNKALLCKPITMTKATSCRPHTQSKEVQTDKSEPDRYFIPVPVPIYVPTPLSMYSMPTPILVPVPVPVPVPIFIPTTKKSATSILKQIKDIREKIPADPLEAELLMMADMVAGKEDSSGTSSSEEEEEIEAPVSKVIKDVTPTPGPSGASGADLGEDMLQMALRMATEMSEEPAMDLENSLEPVAVNTAPPQPIQASAPDDDDDEDEYIPASTRSRRSRGGGSTNKRQSNSTPRRQSKRQKVDTPQPLYKDPSPSPPPPAVAPPPDMNFHLKYTYGVNAFKHWVLQKNAQLEQTSKTGYGKTLKTFKSDILQCTADELNYSLCLFVKEVRKPNGEEYAVDSIYYLCLGLQQYLFESGRIDNIFGDYYYERFTECLNELLTKYEPKLNHTGQLVCRIEEEHLWESKQLGAHSPHVLLNSLVYFNTKYFMLKTSEDHLRLSFTHIMKHWKKTPSGRGSGTGPNSGRSVYLRYYCPTPQGKEVQQQKKKKEEMPVYEQTENFDNPLRCPVKLYEFYLSKCPESIKNRNDTFYLVPERSCVPDSPVWYSTSSLGVDHMAKMLNRIRLVREIQEAHLHTQPVYV